MHALTRGVVLLAGASFGAAHFGCASESSKSSSEPPSDGAAAERGIRLTLPPLYDELVTENGSGGLIPLGGAQVCVVKARPWGGAWSSFVTTNGPCAPAVAGERIVLQDVPRDSELLVTAEKEGYWPSLFAVTTDQWDQDTTSQMASFSLRLRRSDAPWPMVPSSVAVSQNLGMIQATAVACQFTDCRFAGGARMELGPAPASDQGPFYFVDGILDPGATQTRIGGRINPLARTWEEFFFDGPATGVSFVNMAEDEYQLTVSVLGLSCRVLGWLSGDPFYGFAPHEGATAGVPVLAGHYTPAILVICQCDPSSTLDVDAGVCVENVADAFSSG